MLRWAFKLVHNVWKVLDKGNEEDVKKFGGTQIVLVEVQNKWRKELKSEIQS